MKTFNEVLDEVNAIFILVLHKKKITLTRETTAADVPEWDSLSHIELVIAIEKHFKMKFNFSELQKFKNIGELCDAVLKKIQ